MAENPRIATRDQLLHRICGEYLEMPGLRLRREQAQRLWALDKDACTELLEALVESKFLQRCADGSYARLSEGTVGQPLVSMTNTPLAARPSARPVKKHSAA